MQYIASYSLGGAPCGSAVTSSRRKCGVLNILWLDAESTYDRLHVASGTSVVV